MKHDVIIIGGGLSGLALADHLQRSGIDFVVLESRNRFGGRIKAAHHNDATFDLGPSWFWPGQPRMAALCDRFGLSIFQQYSTGDYRYQQQSGQVQQASNYAPMIGSLRIDGGIISVINSLVSTLPNDRLVPDAHVIQINQSGSVTLENGTQYQAQKIILALPPRISANIDFHPQLPSEKLHAMQNIPTWMAGHAKALILYETAFWRDKGLSGSASSQQGPLAEIHDASNADETVAALFGFVGVPATKRIGHTDELRQSIKQQLSTLFGPNAPAPQKVILTDWATSQHTATQQDQMPLGNHPQYGLPHELNNIWDDKIILGSTEVAPEFGGFLEGALVIAEQLAAKITRPE